jgi:3-dehydroquinate dehydratase type I
MSPKIIIPLCPKNITEAIQKILVAEKHADIIEIWFDKIKNLDQAKINKIIQSAKKPLIVNFKNQKEKGSSPLSDKQRIELLKFAADAKVDFIDVSLDLPTNLIKELKARCKKTQLILSFHDFQKMPDIKHFQKLAKKAFQLKADLVKLVGTAKSFAECVPILQISQELAKKKKKFLTIAMGKHGELTRVITPLIGGLGMFAPLSAKNATAAGQLTVRELKKWWSFGE